MTLKRFQKFTKQVFHLCTSGISLDPQYIIQILQNVFFHTPYITAPTKYSRNKFIPRSWWNPFSPSSDCNHQNHTSQPPHIFCCLQIDNTQINEFLIDWVQFYTTMIPGHFTFCWFVYWLGSTRILQRKWFGSAKQIR